MTTGTPLDPGGPGPSVVGPPRRSVTGPRPRWTWALAVLLATLGVVALLTRPTAPALPPPGTAGALTAFPDDVLARVAAWVGPIRVAVVVGTALQLLVPWLLVGTRRGRALVRRIGGSRAAVWRGAATVVVATALAGAPLRWWIGWSHAGAFGFRTATAERFVLEAVAEVLVAAVLQATAVALVVWLARRRPHDWPAVGAVLGTVATVALVVLHPLVVTEVLYRPVPLTDPVVLAAVEPVVAASELAGAPVEVGRASVRTTRVNAFVTGVGPAERIVVWDTLLTRPPERVAAVVAHEVAHAEHADVARGVLASATGILLALLVLRAADRRLGRRGVRPAPAVLGAGVAAAVVVLELVALPVVAWESRRAEAAADHRALELTDDPAGLVAVTRGFVLEDLADPTPPAWVRLRSSHPTPEQRIRAATGFAQVRGLDAGAPTTGTGGAAP